MIYKLYKSGIVVKTKTIFEGYFMDYQDFFKRINEIGRINGSCLHDLDQVLDGFLRRSHSAFDGLLKEDQLRRQLGRDLAATERVHLKVNEIENIIN